MIRSEPAVDRSLCPLLPAISHPLLCLAVKQVDGQWTWSCIFVQIGSLVLSAQRVFFAASNPTEASSSSQFALWVAFFEIYNECVYDLLQPTLSSKLKKRATLRVCDDGAGNAYVKGTRIYICLISYGTDDASIFKLSWRTVRFSQTWGGSTSRTWVKPASCFSLETRTEVLQPLRWTSLQAEGKLLS